MHLTKIHLPNDHSSIIHFHQEQEITINQSNHIQELNNPTKVASPFDNIVIIVETYKT